MWKVSLRFSSQTVIHNTSEVCSVMIYFILLHTPCFWTYNDSKMNLDFPQSQAAVQRRNLHVIIIVKWMTYQGFQHMIHQRRIKQAVWMSSYSKSDVDCRSGTEDPQTLKVLNKCELDHRLKLRFCLIIINKILKIKLK